MLHDNELVRTYLKNLQERIEQQQEFVLQGPSSNESCDEVSMEYMRRVGALKEAQDLKELFEHTVRTFYE